MNSKSKYIFHDKIYLKAASKHASKLGDTLSTFSHTEKKKKKTAYER